MYFKEQRGRQREKTASSQTCQDQIPIYDPAPFNLSYPQAKGRLSVFLSGKHSINNADYMRKATDKAFYYPTWGPCDFLYGESILVHHFKHCSLALVTS